MSRATNNSPMRAIGLETKCKRTALILCSVLIAILFSNGYSAGRSIPTTTTDGTTLNHPSEIEFEALDWQVPTGEEYREQLSNGLRTYIATDSSLPLVTIKGYISHSSINDPENKKGLGTLMSRLLRRGGTEKFPADSLNELVDLLSIKFSFSQNEAYMSFSATFLSEYLDTAMVILEEMFFRPAFDESVLEREKRIMKESIRHRFVNPQPVLHAAYKKQFYSETILSPITTLESIESITREDLIELHDQVFTTDNIILSFSGSFDREDMISRLENTFPSASNARGVVAFDEISPNTLTDALIVHRPINQTYVRMGVPLFSRPHPDYYAVSVMNLILGGGGFTSRLGTKVRSDAGLTYSIFSRGESNYQYPGTLHIEFNTRTETLPLAISLVLKEVENLIENGVTEEELENAKATIIAQLPGMFRSVEDITDTYTMNEYFGRAPDHFVVYPQHINDITVEDIQRVAQKYLNPDEFIYTIVTDTEALKNLPVTDDGFDVLGIENKLIIEANEIETLP
ncbi:pitrilysin family protein [Chitinispirillales bacterium ANBcel5]|uniref:M16 family metallopeptidase n=1 Tax=Cellulosispirillum alkaliphilum TaxID=3039283 RepID=UPI002A52BE10|nr:pitrilysin family protein [Chitinispirillales bacterium ANBcel5]